MAPAARIFVFAMLASAVCFEAGGCVSSNRLDTSLNRADGLTGAAPVTIPYFKLITPVPPPTGFSSTYQKCLIDRQRLARRQNEQYVQAVAASKIAAENDRAAPIPPAPGEPAPDARNLQ
jgi:hypothetical protein